jgi:KaiC/GvpD/RAD55 family RecA-like ATPase
MVFGAPLIGKSIFVRNLFCEKISEGFGGIYVTTRDIAEDLLRWFNTFGIDGYRIVDCVSKTMMQDAVDEKNIKRVSVMDLTAISVRINCFLEEYWREGKREIVIVFDSLSSLLMYLNPQAVFRFLHVLASRVRASGGIAFYIVEEGMHDPKTTATLKQLFNGAIELKEEENSRLFRFVSSSLRINWKKFDVENNRIVMRV